MKTCEQAMSLAASVAMAFTTAVFAQPEQWLQYHTSSEGRGFRWLELTTEAPAGVALPPVSGQAWFAHWQTPLDPQGRWICFDRTRRSGPHHRVFIDRSGDGRLAEEPPLDAARVDQYSASFDPVRLVFQGEDGPIIYHLALRFMRYDEGDARALVQSACYYAGNVNLAGQQRVVTLIDANVNGTFNDQAPNPADCDAIRIHGDPAGQRILGRLLEVGDQFFALEVAQDGAFLKVQLAQEVALGTVRVPDALSEIIAVGRPGHFLRQPVNGEFTLPVGQYRVHGWHMNRKDDQGADWRLHASGFGEFANFEVTAEQPAAIDVGEPLLAALTVTENRGGAAFGLQLKGRLGETVQLLKGDARPRPPRLHLAGAGGSFRAAHTFEYG